jgi:hypothetical protein
MTAGCLPPRNISWRMPDIESDKAVGILGDLEG